MAINLSDSYRIINWDLNTKALDTTYWGKTTDSGRGCKVALKQNNVVKTPTTETMRINFKKPSGLQIFIDGVISGNYFVFDFTEQVYAEQGEVKAELMLNVGGEFIMSSTFTISVDVSFTSGIESSSEFTALQTALSDVNEVKTDITELQNPAFTEASTLANIASGESQAMLWGKVNGMFSFIGTDITRLAPNYSASSYYGVGAFVINNNKLYRCATKVSNYESFDATKWTAISLINYLADPMTNTATNEVSYVAAGGGSLVKIGRNVELTLSFKSARPIPSGAPVMSLPVGYKPAYGSKDFVLRSLNNPKIANKFTIGSDGVVVYTDNAGDIPTDSWGTGTISFLTNQ